MTFTRCFALNPSFSFERTFSFGAIWDLFLVEHMNGPNTAQQMNGPNRAQQMNGPNRAQMNPLEWAQQGPNEWAQWAQARISDILVISHENDIL